MKKLIPALICLIFILSGCNAKPDTSAAVQSAEDLPDTMQTTTIEDATYYMITTEDELLSIGKSHSLSENYMLGSDITLTEEWKPIGSKKDPFTGIFDGNGYKIYNLTITEKSGDMGFFAASEGAVIRNLILENAHINHQTSFSIVCDAAATEFTDCHINQSK